MKIMIADDHSIIRAALRSIVEALSASIDIVEVASFSELISTLDTLKDDPPDLVTLDLNMPGSEGAPSVAQVVARSGKSPVVVFSMTEDAAVIRACFAAGVRGFVPKSTDHPQLVGILNLILAGGVYVPPQLAFGAEAQALPATAASFSIPQPAAGQATLSPSLPAANSLTRRQRDVMELLANGMSNNEIGHQLGLNLSTVKAHVSGVLRGLGVNSRTQAAIKIRQILNDS